MTMMIEDQASRLRELARPEGLEARFEFLAGRVKANRLTAKQYRDIGSLTAVAKANHFDAEADGWQRELDSIRLHWGVTGQQPDQFPVAADRDVLAGELIDIADLPARIPVKPTLEQAITMLGESSNPDEIAAVLDRLSFYLERGKALKELLDGALIKWINANGRLSIGDIEYYVGVTKPTPKCRNVAAALDAAFNHFGGSVEDVAKELLGSQPFKYGAFKSLVGEDEYAKHFFTEPKPKVEQEKKLQRVDTKFIG